MTVARFPTLCLPGLLAFFMLSAQAALGEEAKLPRTQLREPVYRTANAPSERASERPAAPAIAPNSSAPKPQVPPSLAPKSPAQEKPSAKSQPAHPLDPALNLAREGLQHMRQNVRDYTCTLVKREQVNGKVGEFEYIQTKIRNRKLDDNRVVVPFGVYMQFLNPAAIKGREVLFVEGRNGGKLIAHEGGVKGRLIPTVRLDPTGTIAMRNNRYPITEVGLENLLVKLLEKGERDRKYGDVQVEFRQGAKVNDRTCTVLQVTHPTPSEHFDFHIAQIFIDDELRVPVRYAAFSWPVTKNGQPVLVEEYTYLDLKLNVGLTDADFESKNPAYRF